MNCMRLLEAAGSTLAQRAHPAQEELGLSAERGFTFQGKRDEQLRSSSIPQKTKGQSVYVPQKLKGNDVYNPYNIVDSTTDPSHIWSARGPEVPAENAWGFRSMERVMRRHEHDYSRFTRTPVGDQTVRFHGSSRYTVMMSEISDVSISAIIALDVNHCTVGSINGSVRIVHWESGSVTAAWNTGSKPITAFAKFFDGARVITGASNGKMAIWDRSGVMRCTLVGHVHEVRSIELLTAHKNRAVSGSRDATVRLWNLIYAECLHSVNLTGAAVTTLRCFDVEQVALHNLAFAQASDDLRLRFWSVLDGSQLVMWSDNVDVGHEQIVAIDVSRDGLVAIGARGLENDSSSLCVLNARTMDEMHQKATLDGKIQALCIVMRTVQFSQLLVLSKTACLKCFSFPDLEALWEERLSTSSQVIGLDFWRNHGCISVFAATALPEVFVWSWNGPAALRNLTDPPVLRSRIEGCTESTCPNREGNQEQDDSTPSDAKHAARSLDESSTLETLKSTFSFMQADVRAVKAKWQTGSLTLPPKIDELPPRVCTDISSYARREEDGKLRKMTRNMDMGSFRW